ncbi:MAG: hypothetical protein M3Q95_15160 [Bacteroidota bacterium]|nr:hypothetical protein [Bacteroidota bacterium]
MFRSITDKLKAIKQSYSLSRKRKIFCIGRNKTGTTSMAEFFRLSGLIVAPQTPAELLIDDWKINRFDRICNFVKYHGEVFQDIPFSLPGTYKELDKNFPGSKYILTVRDNPEQWYNSLLNFHSRLLADGRIPTRADLMNSTYNGKGWLWKTNRYIYNTPEDDVYHKETLLKHYTDYNNDVIEYFRDDPSKLLVINLNDSEASAKISNFIGMRTPIENMPWENKT